MANKKINELTASAGVSGTDLMIVGDPTLGTSYKTTLQSIADFVGLPPVTSVFGRTGAITATAGDYTLSQIGGVVLTSPTSSQVLQYNGTNWVNVNFPCVTSVDVSVPTGLSVSGNPITSSGTIAISYAAGYGIPTTLKQSNWDDAYTFVSAFPTQTGNAGKYLTTNGSVLSWANVSTGSVTSVAIATGSTGTDVNVSGSPITTSGTITINLPSSSATNRGVLTAADWTTFNGKLTSPMTTLGDLIYQGASAATRLAGNTTAVKQYLSQTGTGTISAAPSWATITGADITGAALTSTNDTNVTITLGGTPATSLLRAASITLGWTGTLAVGRGGTGLSALGTANQLIRVNAGATALEYFTPTYLTANQSITWTAAGDISGTASGTTSITPTLTTTGLRGVALPTLSATAGFLRYTGTGTNTWVFDSSTYLTANQTITLSGNVTGSGTTSITTTIANNVVTNAMLSQVATATFKGRTTAATGNVEDLTATQATALLDTFTTTLKGLAPASGGGTTNFLRADGTWAAPSGTGFTNPMTTLGDTMYATTGGAAARLAGNITTTKQFLSQTGTGSASAAPAWSAVTKSDVGLANVENTALSTWAGSTNITTLGTITSGTWTGTTIGVANGGTGATTLTGILVGSGTSAVTAVAGTASQLLRRNAGNTAYEFFTATFLTSAITSLGGLTAATQTFANDTNVTITSATSTHTLGWTGQLSIARGGTGLSALGTANQLLRTNATATALEYFTPTYLTANQSITLSGDVTGTGSTAITTTIANNAVTLAKMQTISTASFLGRVTAATGNVENITGTQATTLLDVFSSTLKGLVPASGGGTTNFLRADGTWAAPTGGGTLTGSGTANTISKWTSTTALGNSSITDTGTNVGILGTTTFSTAAGLPASTGGTIFIADDFTSPTAGRIFFGDGTGWSMHFSKRNTSVTSDIITITDAGNFSVNSGRIYSGNVSSTNGSILLQDNYSSGNLTTIGTSFSSGGPIIGYGVYPSSATQYAFLSATPLTSFPRGAVVVEDSFKYFSGAAQTASVGSATTMTKLFEVATNGQLKLPNYTATGSFTGTAAGYLAFDSSGNILTTAAPSGTTGNMSAISIRRTTTYNLTATLTAVTFDANDVINNTAVLDHSTSTNTERIVIGETGLYQITYSYSFSDSGSTTNNNIQAGVYVNDTTLVPGSTLNSQNSSSDESALTKVCYSLLTAGQYITFKAAHNGTANGTIRIGAQFGAVLMKGPKGDTGASGSGGGYTISTITASYTETATSGHKVILVDTLAGNITITLPTAVGNTAMLTIKKILWGNNVIIDANGAQLIDGALTATIVKIYESVTLVSDGTQWHVI